jgi:5-(carboxyamino)imidazole ribonucleotide synthase
MILKNIYTPTAPGNWLGILGGGQLGRMFTHAAQAMGYRVCVLDPDRHSPAAMSADEHICADYDDIGALDMLAQRCRRISTEFENIPATSLARLEQQAVAVSPSSQSIALMQDRIAEKNLIHGCAAQTGIDVAPYFAIETEADLADVPDALFPGILKTARMGYDGKGQTHVANSAELRLAWQSLGYSRCVLEQRLSLAVEVSVVLARAHNGQYVCYPPIENIHRQGILHTSTFPAINIDAETSQLIQHAAFILAEKVSYIGVLCVEFFVLQNGRVVVNEMAPRPHNSGHITLNACSFSQFEQQVRIMAGLPLGHTHPLCPGMMLNLLGDLWFPGQKLQTDSSSASKVEREDERAATRQYTQYGEEPHSEVDKVIRMKRNWNEREPAWEKLCALPDAHLYLYGKSDPRPGRKMGHLNLLGNSSAQLADTYVQACTILGIQP